MSIELNFNGIRQISNVSPQSHFVFRNQMQNKSLGSAQNFDPVMILSADIDLASYFFVQIGLQVEWFVPC